MADVIILEFDADPALYDQVNEALGLDPAGGTGDWPKGLMNHVGAARGGNGITVVEVWESQADQQAFMESRLGPALGKVGVPEPKRVEWMGLKGQHVS
jgi:hypothetical protein